MSFATLTANLETYLAAAGATMTNPAVAGTVVAGEPTNIDRPTIAYWFIGVKTWESNTLGKTQEMWGFHIALYYPFGQRNTPPRSQVEQWIGGVAMAVRSQLYGHVSVGGTATGLGMELTDAVASDDTIAGVGCRRVDMEWWPFMAAVATIA